MAADDPVATVAVAASPFGPIHLAVHEHAVVALGLRTTDDAFSASLRRRLHGRVAAAGRGATGSVDGQPGHERMLGLALRGLEAYLAGDPTGLDLPVELVGLSPWDVRVLTGVRAIPFGAVTSYGRLARRIGSPGAARAVGGAVGRNPVGLLVPCHRVIAGDGTLGGYGGGPWGDREESLELKRALLEHERVVIPARELLE